MGGASTSYISSKVAVSVAIANAGITVSGAGLGANKNTRRRIEKRAAKEGVRKQD